MSNSALNTQGVIMVRCLILVAGITACTTFVAASHNGTPTQVEELQEKRVELLTQRAAFFKSQTDAGEIKGDLLYLARIDLIKVQLDYADSSSDKQRYLNEMLETYDKLIEMADMQIRAGIAGGTAQADLLLLKSERVRCEIRLTELE